MTMPVPRGRKSFPTTASSTELFPELCNVAHCLVFHRETLEADHTTLRMRIHGSRSECAAPAILVNRQCFPSQGYLYNRTCPPMTTMLGSIDQRLGSDLSPAALSPSRVAAPCRRLISCTTPSMAAILCGQWGTTTVSATPRGSYQELSQATMYKHRSMPLHHPWPVITSSCLPMSQMLAGPWPEALSRRLSHTGCCITKGLCSITT